MKNVERQLDRDEMIPILLDGGPHDLVTPTSASHDVIRERRIRILDGNGYEHFEMSSEEVEHGSPVPFRWTMRTKIAE